jgi:glucokinase
MSNEFHRYAVGIDFGGTNLKLGLMDERGKVLAAHSVSTREVQTPDAWLDRVERLVGELRVKAGRTDRLYAGIGVGVPGFVDFDRGYIHDLTNVPGWTAVHLAEKIRERFHVPAYVDNDVNVMALGECTFGTGRLYQHAVFVTLGTGVGGGLVINNKIYRGAHSMAGEIGHVSIDMHGVKSPQGRGGLEQYVGNQRLLDRLVAALEKGRPSRLRDYVQGDLRALSLKLLDQAAQEGDELALETFDFMADCLATAFASVTYLLQPQVFIVGGGVAGAGDLLFGPLRRHLQDRLSPYFAERIEVKPAELGNQAGLIGAATLALIT